MAPVLPQVDSDLSWAIASPLAQAVSITAALPPQSASADSDLCLGSRGLALPFWAARDILRAHHVLRC